MTHKRRRANTTVRRLLAPVALALLVTPASALASPAPGSLDPTFGDHGTVLNGFASYATSVAVGDSNRIVAAGVPGFAVARYKPNGHLDRSFSKDGKVRTRFPTRKGGNHFTEAEALAITGRGKVVVVGTAPTRRRHSNPQSVAIARYKANGRLDHSFSNDGKQRIRLSSRGAQIGWSVAIDSQGRTVIGCESSPGSAIVRLKRNGSLDRSFSNNGIANIQRFGGVISVAIDSSGRIVGLTDSALFRYRPNGKRDSSFGDHGKVEASGTSATLDRRGRILVAGLTPDQRGVVVTRFKEDGSPDPSFGSGGEATVRFSDFLGLLVSVAVEPPPHRERIVVSSNLRKPPVGDASVAAVARFKPNGKLDDSFGDRGKVETNLPGDHFRQGGIAIDHKQGIVDAGSAKKKFMLARFVG